MVVADTIADLKHPGADIVSSLLDIPLLERKKNYIIIAFSKKISKKMRKFPKWYLVIIGAMNKSFS